MLTAELTQALVSITERLAPEPGLRWLVGGSAALALQGVALPDPPRDLDLLSSAAGAERIAALFAGNDTGVTEYAVVAPLNFSAQNNFSGLRGQFRFAASDIDLLGDVCVSGAAGQLQFDLETIWPSRAVVSLKALGLSTTSDALVNLVPLEYKLAVELLRGRSERAQLIAAHLHQRGFEWHAFSMVLAAAPGLEPLLWETLNTVVPLARRAARRRARQQTIREQIEYFRGKQEKG